MGVKKLESNNSASTFRVGPSVKDMYNALQASKEAIPDFVLGEVHIAGMDRGVIDWRNRWPKIFRNEQNLQRHASSEEAGEYRPATADEIWHHKDRLHDYEPPESAEFNPRYLHRPDEGSFITFQDLDGLIEGRIEYALKPFKDKDRKANIGCGCWVLLAGGLLGLALPEGLNYVALIGAGLLGSRYHVNARNIAKGVPQRYLLTTLKIKKEGEEAEAKLEKVVKAYLGD